MPEKFIVTIPVKPKPSGFYPSISLDQPLIRLQNELILKWTPKVRSALRRRARWFSDGKFSSPVIRHQSNRAEKKLAQSIASKIGKQFGLAS